MVDSSSQALIEELNTKHKRRRIGPFTAIAAIIAAVVGAEYQIPAWGFYGVAVLGIILTALAYYRDTLAKTTVILYDFEPEFKEAIKRFYTAFEHMNRNEAIWHIEATCHVNDRKYHAGASTLAQRRKITLRTANPPFIKTNVQVPRIPVGRQTLYFFPTRY